MGPNFYFDFNVFINFNLQSLAISAIIRTDNSLGCSIVNCTRGITLEAIMKKISALLLLSAIALSGCSAIGTTSGVVTSDPVSAGKQ